MVIEAKATARAEISYQVARLTLSGRMIGRIAGFGVLALALIFFALMALVVGLLLALAPALGIWGAMAAVIGLLLLALLWAVLAIRSGWRRLRRLFAEEDAQP